MRFEEPLWLLLCLPVLASGWAALRWGDALRAALPYPGAVPHASLSRAKAALVRAAPQCLKTAVLLLCVAALARPQAVRRGPVEPAQGVDILLALDTSKSMLALDFEPRDRMGAAKEAAKRFVSGRVNDRIGLVVFGGAAVLACPFTLDYEALLDYLDGAEAGMTQTDGTAIGDAIATAVDHLRSGRAKSRVIILLTDGSSNAGAIDPLTAAKAAKALGIKIYAVGAARRGEALVPVQTPFGRVLQKIPDELDEDLLLRIAAETDGKYFRAGSLAELSQVYSEIDRLEKTRVRRPPALSYRDLHVWLLLPAAALLLAELALAGTFLLRVP